MNRRHFLKLVASLLPVPAFVKASSLWLPEERIYVPRADDMAAMEQILKDVYAQPIAAMLNSQSWLMALIEYNRERSLILEWARLDRDRMDMEFGRKPGSGPIFVGISAG